MAHNQRYSWTNTDIALATGDDAGAGSGLTDWINAKAAFIQGELKPTDRFISASVRLPQPKTSRQGTMKGDYVSGRRKAGRIEGEFRGKFYLQTAQFCYWLMQTVGTPTTENTPAGYNTHLLTIGKTQVPDWHGLHLQRKVTTKHRLIDIIGLLPNGLAIDCSEEKFNAEQNITIPFAYAGTGANLTPETKRPDTTIGSIAKTWEHAVAGGLGENQIALEYNGVAVPLAIKGVHIALNRTSKFGIRDSASYPADGFMKSFDYPVTLDIEPYDKVAGTSIFDINDLNPLDYAGDLDLSFAFEADAVNDKITFAYDKLALVPFDESAMGEGLWFEGYSIVLEPLNENSSLTITGIDNLNNDHYENP